MFAPVSQHLSRAALALVLSASACMAQASTLHVELDTSGWNGTDGYLDLQFNPSNVNSAVASALVSALSGITADAPALTGDVQALAGGVYKFTNSSDYNDLFQSVHFGGKVSFNVSFSGLPDSAALPQSSFSVGLYGSDGQTSLGQGDQWGSLLYLNWQASPDGQGSVGKQMIDGSVGAITAVPEPSSWLMLGAGLGLLGLVRRRRVSHN
jgi:hypothetical protein